MHFRELPLDNRIDMHKTAIVGDELYLFRSYYKSNRSTFLGDTRYSPSLLLRLILTILLQISSGERSGYHK
jgi:hypothetical protein